MSPDYDACNAKFPADGDIASNGVMASFIVLAWTTWICAAVPTGYHVHRSWVTAQGTGFQRIGDFILNCLSVRSRDPNDLSAQRGVLTPRISEDKLEPSQSPLPSPALEHDLEKGEQAVEATPVNRNSTFTDLSESGLEDDLKISRDASPAARPLPMPTPLEPQAGFDLHPPPEGPLPQNAFWRFVILVAERWLYPLCDIQIITGLAMIILGMSKYPHITFYHEQFVVNYWWLTLNSLWVSRIDYAFPDPQLRSWRYAIRRLAILTSVVLSVVFQALVANREHLRWQPDKPGRCYKSSSFDGENFTESVFWLAGTAMYCFVLIVTFTHGMRVFLYKHVFMKLDPSINKVSSWVSGAAAAVTAYAREGRKAHNPLVQAGTLAWLCLKVAGFAALWAGWWALVQFIAIWGSGNASYLIELIVYGLFAGASTLAMVEMKIDNKSLVVGDEDRWSFVQTLAIMLILLAFVHLLDVAEFVKRGKGKWK